MADYVHNPDDLTPQMTSNSAPSPNIVSASSTYHIGEEYYCFNHDPVVYWVASSGNITGWIKFDFGSGNEHKVNEYLMAAHDYGHSTTSPKSWTFQGSNDDSTWTTLDTQTNQALWDAKEMRTYAFTNNVAYRYFKIDVTENQGSTDLLRLGEIELYIVWPSEDLIIPILCTVSSIALSIIGTEELEISLTMSISTMALNIIGEEFLEIFSIVTFEIVDLQDFVDNPIVLLDLLIICTDNFIAAARRHYELVGRIRSYDLLS